MRGLVADANIQGHVEHLVERMRDDAWADFWQASDTPKPATVATGLRPGGGAVVPL